MENFLLENSVKIDQSRPSIKGGILKIGFLEGGPFLSTCTYKP